LVCYLQQELKKTLSFSFLIATQKYGGKKQYAFYNSPNRC